MNTTWKPYNSRGNRIGTWAAHELVEADGISAIHMKGYLTPSQCQEAVSHIDAVGMEYHEGEDKAGGIVRKGKLGPNFYRYRDQSDEYFRLVEHSSHSSRPFASSP